MEKKEHEPRKLFIGGIPRLGLTADMVRAHFARYGHVVEALVMAYPDGFGRGVGFVEFEDEEAVLRALDSKESDRHDAFFSCKVSFLILINLSPAFKINRFAAAAMFGCSVFLLVLRNRKL